LIGYIGLISALLQGAYVRKTIPKVGEGVMAHRGVSSCIIALAIMSVLPQLEPSLSVKAIYIAAVFLAFTSATVVNSLTALASIQCDSGVEGKGQDGEKIDLSESEPELAKGLALGKFRSAGQLGRAVGPLLGTNSENAFIAE
jgi:hypothetical protein